MKWRESHPKNEAAENDFQTLVGEDGAKSDALENSLSALENDFIKVVRKIEETHRVPQNEEELKILLSMMGFFAMRIPKIRERLREIFSDVITKIANLQKVSREKIANIFKPDPMWELQKLFDYALHISEYLSLRNWMVVEAPGPYFVTSNKPVNPFWSISHPPEQGSFFNPTSLSDHPTLTACYLPYNEQTKYFPPYLPGFRSLNSIIIFPLTPTLALIGSWWPLPDNGKVDYCVTQGINWVTVNSSADYIYSPQKFDPAPWNSSFIHFLQEYHIHLGSRLLDF